MAVNVHRCTHIHKSRSWNSQTERGRMRKAALVVAVLFVSAAAFASSTRVPEPGSVALLLSGIGALAFKLRRK